MADVETRNPSAGRDHETDARFLSSYETHLPAIVRYLRRRLGESAAEDAAAEVFFRAFRQATERNAVPLSLPWLYGIAANVIREERRSERRRLRALERLGRDRGVDSLTAPESSPDLDPHLVRCLRRLSHADRETLLLVAWGELTYDEVAAALQVPVGTVASRIARARRQLDAARSMPPAGAVATPIRGDAHV